MGNFWESPNYLALTGSRLYGVHNENSDYDYRGFVLEPIEFLLGIQKFEQYESPTEDKVIYSLKKFLQLLLGGNISCLEALYSPEYKADAIGTKIRDNRELFLSKKYFRSIRGFANQEARKVKGIQLQISDKVPIYYSSIQQISQAFQLKNFERDDMIEWLKSIRPDVELTIEKPHLGGIGQKRKDSIEKYGYSVKNAANCIRLLYQGIELLRHGTLTFPRPEAEHLCNIRNGNYSVEQFETEFAALDLSLCAAMDDSMLPKQTDIHKVNTLYIDIIKGML